MRRSLFAMPIAGAAVLAALCGCTSTSAGSSGSSAGADVPAAVKLANLDGITNPTAAQIAAYQQALTTLDQGCGGTDDANATLVNSTRDLDAKHGVNDSELTIAQAVAQTAASGAVKGCLDLFGAYATLRDPG